MFLLFSTEVVNDVINNVVRPLLYSPVPSPPPSSFREAVNTVIRDIETVLNGKHVDLKETIANYFRAVALYHLNDILDSFPLSLIRLSDSQKRCASQVLFDRVYTTTESAEKLIGLFQNISVAVSVIKQVRIYIYIHTYIPVLVMYAKSQLALHKFQE